MPHLTQLDTQLSEYEKTIKEVGIQANQSVLSNELQIGKAGEHIVCADLILQGFNAFLADQGLPYDILVDLNGELKRIQTKTTQKLVNYPKAICRYRFGTRRAKGNRTRIDIESIDFFAFVALDIMKIAYLPISEMITRNNTIKQTMDFKTRRLSYAGRIYSTGTQRRATWGNYYFEDFGKFQPEDN